MEVYKSTNKQLRDELGTGNPQRGMVRKALWHARRALSRAELATALKVPESTLTPLLNEYVAQGAIERAGAVSQSYSTPPTAGDAAPPQSRRGADRSPYLPLHDDDERDSAEPIDDARYFPVTEEQARLHEQYLQRRAPKTEYLPLGGAAVPREKGDANRDEDFLPL